MNGDPNIKLLAKLRHEKYFSHGRNEAFIFALRCQGDLEVLIGEIANAQQRIDDGLERDPQGAMAMGSGPRSYLEGYRTGLENAVQIIRDTP